MISFHGDQQLKDDLLDRIAIHEEMGGIIQGAYWRPSPDGVFRGCALACMISDQHDFLTRNNRNIHREVSKRYGFPIWMADLVEAIHESLDLEEARKWPRRFAQAMPVGVDLDEVKLVRHINAYHLEQQLVALGDKQLIAVG